jgi:hypothetical protein
MARTSLALLILIAALLVGCADTDQESPDNDADTTPSAQVTGESYPGPSTSEGAATNAYPGPDNESVTTEDAGYPVPDEPAASAYPAPDEAIDESKRFTLQEPIASGQLEVSGSGVPEISIKIISISNAGEALGFGVVSPDGEFTIGLNRAAEGGELLGIQFADDSTPAALEGVPGTDFPLIGLILAQAVVER